MDTVLIAAIVCLSLLLLAVVFKYITLKKQIRSFGRQIECHRDIEYNCPVKVDTFDKDIVELAVNLNEQTKMRHRLNVEYRNNREQLNNVISGISHDFRTPLTASLGYLQMIEKSGELSEKNAEYLEIAIRKNEYLKELSDEFFELSKLENGSEETVTESINLSNLISDMLMEQYGWMQERNITPDFRIADGIVIESSRPYVIRIVQNILSNAEKYAVGCLSVSLSESGGRIKLSAVNDTEDISDIDINRIFEPFYKPSSRNKSGSGLGLYVVKRLSEKLDIQVTAGIDENGSFRISVDF